MRRFFLLLLGLGSANCNAEVFKCTEKYGKTVYQSSPCKAATKEQQLEIKTDPAREAAAKAKLEAIQNEYDARKSAQEKANKEREEQQRARDSLEIARRSAAAQQEQAHAQQRQADALEKQNQSDNRPMIFLPPMVPNYPAGPHPSPRPQPRPMPDNNRLDAPADMAP
ncbi:DUF4124 domain-containing protein [Methylomonas sp. SURF-2]|uniref:DUF4124 domain-containing protein n=1 Tax=Methylomonas subterranea TaxID=2952225 RepID=A0ABT1TDV5_9GAMM|nr:DUF4124 domain-containing protein [Methylomonas sp. SURF-2]MCQ8103641.1 DUF4124 domain-containing protein [Methylomonas sp. SURF-2]